MRLGLVLPPRREAELARAAEGNGMFGVLAGLGHPASAITAATYASTATEFVRVVVALRLGIEHPVTIAEELAILDNVNNGRTVVLVDTGDLDAEAASDEIAVLRDALSCRALEHSGPRWKVPPNLPANKTAPSSISVTPKPAQLEVPFWVTGASADAVSAAAGLPALDRSPRSERSTGLVQPGVTAISGELVRDREAVRTWAAGGTTHLLVEPPEKARLLETMTLISRYLIPEVGMPHFPRVMSDSRVPLPWPGEGSV